MTIALQNQPHVARLCHIAAERFVRGSPASVSCIPYGPAQLIVSVLVLFGVLTIPGIVREGSDFVQRLKAENAWVVVLEKLRHGIGCAASCHFAQAVLTWLPDI